MYLTDLERALSYAQTVDAKTASVVLMNAVGRFLAAQPKASPVTPKQEPGKHDYTEILKSLSQLRSKGCPDCGCPDGVPHYCTGRRSYPQNGTGIEYYLNQPTAVGVTTNGQRTGDQVSRISSR